MAQPTTKSFGQLLVQVGNGASPEVFTAPCGFTEKSLQLSADTSDQVIPDCDNPDAAAWVGREVVSLSATVSGQGVLAVESVAVWRAWLLSAANRNVRVVIAGSGAAGGGYYAGAFKLTSFELGATLGEKVTVNVTAVSDGAVTWTAAA
jgi:predicted secreted protein